MDNISFLHRMLSALICTAYFPTCTLLVCTLLLLLNVFQVI